VVVAIVAPLLIEGTKRPRLQIEWAPDANNPNMYGGPTRITHVKVINTPIGKPFGRFLLRNTATNCRVRLTFTSRSDGKEAWSGPAKWDAQPEPIQWLPHEGGIHEFIDQRSATASEIYDLPPGESGSSLAIALKRDGQVEAWAFSTILYYALPSSPLSAPGILDLASDTDYNVTVLAEAEGISTERVFLLRNRGELHTGLTLEAATK
jgi:hypothetical protein